MWTIIGVRGERGGGGGGAGLGLQPLEFTSGHFRGKKHVCGQHYLIFGQALENINKITELVHWEPPQKAAHLEHSIAIHSISMAGYVTTQLAFVCGELWAWEASSFYGFWRMTSCDFNAFSSLLTQANLCFLMCLIRNIELICVQIWLIFMRWILVNVALSEEVISFWRSVYKLQVISLSNCALNSLRNIWIVVSSSP